jgi:hypothetical protein
MKMKNDKVEDVLGSGDKIAQRNQDRIQDMELLYSLKVHEATWLPGLRNWSVLRVPGGWIYEMHSPNGEGFPVPVHTVFVPYTDEYKREQNPKTRS